MGGYYLKGLYNDADSMTRYPLNKPQVVIKIMTGLIPNIPDSVLKTRI